MVGRLLNDATVSLDLKGGIFVSRGWMVPSFSELRALSPSLRACPPHVESLVFRIVSFGRVEGLVRQSPFVAGRRGQDSYWTARICQQYSIPYIVEYYIIDAQRLTTAYPCQWYQLSAGASDRAQNSDHERLTFVQ